MANLTLSMPDEISEKMKQFPEIKWSEVARKAMTERILNQEEFERIEKIASKSKFTEEDAKFFADKVDKAASKRFMELAKKKGYLKGI